MAVLPFFRGGGVHAAAEEALALQALRQSLPITPHPGPYADPNPLAKLSTKLHSDSPNFGPRLTEARQLSIDELEAVLDADQDGRVRLPPEARQFLEQELLRQYSDESARRSIGMRNPSRPSPQRPPWL